MQVTIAICTRNNCTSLQHTLSALTTLAIPPRVRWEVLVVNNGSTDDTDLVLDRAQAQLPLRRCVEPRAGLAHARNTAVRVARGEYVLWTDDDALVSPAWLAAYCAAFRRWPEAAIFGGGVVPIFTGRPPAWLLAVRDRVGMAYAARPVRPLPARLRLPSDIPYGANYAVRMREQRLWLYDPRLGRRPDSSLGGEETTWVRALLQAGATGWWVPDAAVVHVIPPARQTRAYLRTYFDAAGEFLARTTRPARGTRTLFGRPRWVWRQWLIATLRYAVRRRSVAPIEWIEDLIEASTARGLLRGYGRPFLDLSAWPNAAGLPSVGDIAPAPARAA